MELLVGGFLQAELPILIQQGSEELPRRAGSWCCWTCFSQWFAGIFLEACSTHFQPLASFGGLGDLTQTHMIHGTKAVNWCFRGRFYKFQRANHMQMTMADAVGCSWCRWSQAWGRGMEFTSCGLLPWIVATEGLGELTGCWLKQTECCPESHCWVRTWGRVCTEKRY